MPKKPPSCRAGEHDLDPNPYSVDAGYVQATDGTRVDGNWLRHRCRVCGFTTEKFQAEGDAATAAEVRIADNSVRGSGRREPPPRSVSIWERPALLWALGLIVLALAVYGYYWDSRVRPSVLGEPTKAQPR